MVNTDSAFGALQNIPQKLRQYCLLVQGSKTQEQKSISTLFNVNSISDLPITVAAQSKA
jgi:hypothetical protein